MPRTSTPSRGSKNAPTELAALWRQLSPGTEIELWVQDEARVGQKNALTRRWARRGSRPRKIIAIRTRDWAHGFRSMQVGITRLHWTGIPDHRESEMTGQIFSAVRGSKIGSQIAAAFAAVAGTLETVRRNMELVRAERFLEAMLDAMLRAISIERYHIGAFVRRGRR